MNPAAYLEMAETESKHWWFHARRVILSQMIDSLNLPQNAQILEVGCGTGGNLEMLGKFGNISAVEMDETARDIAVRKTRGCYEIRTGYCPDNIQFSNQRFDLICMFDVLEHIDQDVETLVSIKKLLKHNGRILITVPAYQWLYGAHDKFLHHKRRYTANQLQRKIEMADLRKVRISYFNAILFPLAVIVRLKDKLLCNDSASGTKVPPVIINNILRNLFASERFLLSRINLPLGVSLMAILDANNPL